MYLARHVGRWSTTVIGRFYNGRDHSTVCYGVQRIETLRENDPSVDALITDLKHELSTGDDSPSMGLNTKSDASSVSLSRKDLEQLAELIEALVFTHMANGAPKKGREALPRKMISPIDSLLGPSPDPRIKLS
jgi:hypothetical protein